MCMMCGKKVNTKLLYHQRGRFPEGRGGGGGGEEGCSQRSWMVVCCPLLKTLTLHMTKIFDFCYPIHDLAKTLIFYLTVAAITQLP